MNIKNLVNNFKKTYIGGQEEIVLSENVESRDFLISEEEFSVMDLLSEGPIEGLVDKNGVKVTAERSLCGVYLNDVPVRETTERTSVSNLNTLFVTGNYSTSTREEIIEDLNDFKPRLINSFNNSVGQDNLSAELAILNQVYNSSLLSFLEGVEGISYNSYMKASTPLNIDLDYVKYILVDYTDLKDNWASLNLSIQNNDVKVMYSGENGTGILENRIRKSEEDIINNISPVQINLPDPILNVNMGYERIANSVQLANSLKEGYLLIPLAIGDTIATDENGLLYFQSVDSECIDEVSSELLGARIFLATETSQESFVFNYDKIDFELSIGKENSAGFSRGYRTSRSVDANFKLNGSIEESSFVDKNIPSIASDGLEPGDVLNNLVNKSNTIYNGIYLGDSTYSSTNEDGAQAGNYAQTQYNYAAWAKKSIGEDTRDERDIFEHIVENSSVSDVGIIFTISQLSDTYIKEDHVGTQVSAFLELGIVLGIEGDQNPDDPDYETLKSQRKTYLIALEGIVSQGFRFKIGNYDKGTFYQIKEQLGEGSSFQTKNSGLLTLPNSIKNKNRYIKVYRITPETFSSKRNISISISGINEYYPYNFSYPLSAIALTNISSRSFSSLPRRTFDLKLKKVLVPSNYNPLRSDGTDKRFVDNAIKYENSNEVYKGDWDGTFKLAWTDNPAWIIYDLLINPIYGIGNSIESIEDINIWELYRIGRYADAVDDSGYFVGVPDGYGGLEPRFSFNIVFNNEQEAYDMLNSIAVAFRGSVYYGGSEIDFYYDRPDDVIGIFNNKNVKDGIFNYSDTLKSSRYTVVEVPYLDKRDNFLQKIESYEDEENIAKYGYIKKTFEGIGITSRGQARRFAKYALLSNKYETETVAFVAKEEAMFLSPGDVIRIDDEIKNIDTAEGFLLDVDNTAKKLITNYMDSSQFDTGIYVYKATGETSLKDLFNQDEVSLSDISATNTSKISLYKVDSYQTIQSNEGGNALAINLDASSDLSGVSEGSFFSIKKLGRNENLYKTINITDIGNGEFEIVAMESEQRKYALIESGIVFSDEESYFESIENDFNINDADKPLGLTLDTGLSNGSFTISGYIVPNITEPIASKFEAVLISPFGNSQTKTVNAAGNPTTVAFDSIKEYGGDYVMRVYSIAESPYYSKSSDFVSESITVGLEDLATYNKIRIADVNFRGNTKGYFSSELYPGGNDSGNFRTSSKNFAFDVILMDRFGDKINSDLSILQHWDDPKISIDILDENGTVKKENHIYRKKDLTFYLNEETLKAYFNNQFPRDFRIQIRVTGQSQDSETTGTCVIENPPGTITEWAASSYYDGIRDGFSLNMDAPFEYKGDIEKFTLYTGKGNFTISDLNKFFEIEKDALSTIQVPKKATVYSDLIYPIINNNVLFSKESIKDNLFKQGEEIFFEKGEINKSLPVGISTEEKYQIIIGKTIDSEFFFDADYGYSDGEQTIGSLSYGYQGSVNQDYIEFQRLSATNRDDHVYGGVGLFDSEVGTSDFPVITQDIAYFGKLEGMKNEYSDAFYFQNGGIRIATSGSSEYPMQNEYQQATFATYINSNDLTTNDISTIFDFGSPTGGCLLYVENLVFGNPDFKYTFKAITKDQTAGTGEKIEMTGLVDAVGGSSAFTRGINHLAVTIETISEESSSIVRAKIYADGKLVNSQDVSGWGINDHNHACCIGAMIGDSIDESANTIDNFFKGHMADIVMYNRDLSQVEVQSLFYNSLNEYKFQISSGNREIAEINYENVNQEYTITSQNSYIYKIDISESVLIDGESVNLEEKMLQSLKFTGTIKEFDFANVSSAQDEDLIYGDIVKNRYFLNEIDFKSDNYIWRNFMYPKYKVRYLPNDIGLDAYDKPSSLVLYTPNENEIVNVTGIYVYETGGNKYARLYLDQEYLGLRETGAFEQFPNYDSLIVKDLQNVGITSAECKFINYQNFQNVSTNILLTGTNSNIQYETFTGWNKTFSSSETQVDDASEIVLGKNYQVITDDSEDFYEGVWISPQIPLETGKWYTASVFYKTDTNLESDKGWNYRVILGNDEITYGAVAGITIYPSGNTLEEWKEPAARDSWENYFEYGDTGIITSGDWKRAYFNFKPSGRVFVDSETNLIYDDSRDELKLVQLYLEKSDGALTTGSGIFALPQIELATGDIGSQEPNTWNSPDYPISITEAPEWEGFNDYAQLNVEPLNQSILLTNESIESQNATAQKSVEAEGLYTGNFAKEWTGYIGGPNGERIEGVGNYKRYDNLFNSYMSLTGYYPHGRWIIYSGLNLTGDGPEWGGWEIIAHYTGESADDPGFINKPDSFQWGDDTLSIEKSLPVGAKFETFRTDYSLITNKEATYEISDKIDKYTSLAFEDFNLKVLPLDIWGEGNVFPSGSNNPLQINYVDVDLDAQGDEALILSQNILQLVKYMAINLQEANLSSFVSSEEATDLINDIVENSQEVGENPLKPNYTVENPYIKISYTDPRNRNIERNIRSTSTTTTLIGIKQGSSVNVELLSSTPNANILYRINGSTNQQTYDGNPITLTNGQENIIDMIAKKEGLANSDSIVIKITIDEIDTNN